MFLTRSYPTQEIVAQTARRLLVERIAQQKARARAIHPDYESLWQSIEDLVQAGGKFMRPYLLALSYAASSDHDSLDDILPALGAVELLHVSLLIHDDIIDRDMVRYGIRNITGQRYDEYEPLVADGHDREHFAYSAAILAGDLTLSLAHQLLAESGVSAERLRSATETFNDGLFRVAGGELLDTESAFRGNAAADATLIAREKTASYSVCMPLKLGAALAGESAEHLEQLDRVGLLLGEAYQLQDDILGTFGEESVTGKSADGDLREGKRTYMIEYFFGHATDVQKAALQASFGVSDADEADFATARSVLRASGALEAALLRIDQLTDSAQAEIKHLGWPDACIERLVQLAKRSVHRQK